jgi:sterol desaturase/sphingolipid hydroxylase (fatty acid hydroxylase superfamily)
MVEPLITALVGLVVAFVLGTLAEYVVHRLMHRGIVLHKVHAEHHQLGTGQGWLLEFKDYVVPSLPPIAVLSGLCWWFDQPAAAVGVALGGVLYAAFAAYAHQVQHERPELVFWMPKPVHHLHHAHKMWHHNFGIAFDVWDRVFGTYRPVEWSPPPHEGRRRAREFFRIKWI